MTNNNYPPVYICFDSDESAKKYGMQSCCGGSAISLQPSMRINNNVLELDLAQFNSTPKLGDADEIVGVKVLLMNDKPVVIAIYKDPNKTTIAACCSGSGCYCCAHGCFC